MPELSRSLDDIENVLTRLVRLAHLPRLHERLASEARVSLDRTLYPVLGRLGELGPVRLSDLAGALGLDLSTISRQITSLEEKSLIERRADPADGRASTVSLTRKGRDVLDRLRAVRRKLLTETLREWSQKDIDQLARLLARLTDSFASTTEPR